MPAQQDLNDFDQLFVAQNQAQFSKLAVYFALNQVAYMAQHQPFGDLFGDKPWQPNMGPLMQGVRIEPTPKIRNFFRPNAITARANKDVFDQRENQERASLFWHKFESPLIYFLRNFQDFISNQIKPAMADLNEQVTFANERFIETALWDRAPFIYNCGDAANGPLIAAPNSGPPAYVANPKNQAWLANMLGNTNSGFTLAALDNAFLTLREEQRAAPFEGSKSGIPKDDDLIQGKYLWLTSSEAYSQVKWDPAWERFRDRNHDYVTGKFMGGLMGELLVRGLSAPFRFDATGAAQSPELLIEETGETIPNPAYAKITVSPFELNWLLGADAASTIKIGPPPAEFAGGASAKQVNGMNWNGKVQLTDKILIRAQDSTGAYIYEYNSYNEFLRAQATLTMGLLPGRARNALPMLGLRRRISEAP